MPRCRRVWQQCDVYAACHVAGVSRYRYAMLLLR